MGRLPADIVLLIIDFATLPANNPNVGTLTNPIFQFNHHFRKIALATPSVWGRLWFFGEREARALLERSGECLLDFIGGRRNEGWKEVSPNLARCRSINFKCSEETLHLPQIAWGEPVPVLRSLQVCAYDANGDEPHGLLFGGLASNLCKLHICWLPSAVDPVLGQLVELELCSVRNIDRGDLRLCLNACKNLRHLKLSRSALASEEAEDSIRRPELFQNILPALTTFEVLSLDVDPRASTCVGSFLFPLCNLRPSIFAFRMDYTVETNIHIALARLGLSTSHEPSLCLVPLSQSSLIKIEQIEIWGNVCTRIQYGFAGRDISMSVVDSPRSSLRTPNPYYGNATPNPYLSNPNSNPWVSVHTPNPYSTPNLSSDNPGALVDTQGTFLDSLCQNVRGQSFSNLSYLDLCCACSDTIINLLEAAPQLSSLSAGFSDHTLAAVLERLSSASPSPLLLQLTELKLYAVWLYAGPLIYLQDLFNCLNLRSQGPFTQLSRLTLPEVREGDREYDAVLSQLLSVVSQIVLD